MTADTMTKKSICVFCAARDGNDASFADAAKELGQEIVKSGYNLVYGGGDKGLMGHVARTVREEGGKVVGFIIEELIKTKEAQIEDNILVKDNKACREAMDGLSAAYIALPGRFWTIEEILQAISFSQSSATPKPVVLVDTNGYYAPLKALFDNGVNSLLAAASASPLAIIDELKVDCDANIMYKLISFFETNNPDYDARQCSRSSESGFSAGIVNFSTRYGDALAVIEQIESDSNYNGQFDDMKPALERYAESSSSSTSGISEFCEQWVAVADSKVDFLGHQINVLNKKYYEPAYEYISDMNLEYALTKTVLFDTAIAHGAGSGSSSLGGLIKKTNSKFTKDTGGPSGSTIKVGDYEVDEITWLEKYLDAREELGSSYDKIRIKSYRNLIRDKNYDFDWPARVFDWNDERKDLPCSSVGLSI
ncbi:hypothetical protein IWW40_005409 [Coemansia sp. RSA 1250]|nr:hypothetical protein IWW40_005409 [Coemansia sp. RSA 1250]